MVNYTLVLVYVTAPEEIQEEYQRKVERELEFLGLKILQGIIITWKSRDEIEKRIMKIKDYLIEKFETGVENVEFIVSVIELTEEQYKSIRVLVSKKLEVECRKLLKRIEGLLGRVRSSDRKIIRSLRQEFTRIENDFKRLTELHKYFDIRHSIFEKVNEAMSILRAEFYRRLP